MIEAKILILSNAHSHEVRKISKSCIRPVASNKYFTLHIIIGTYASNWLRNLST